MSQGSFEESPDRRDFVRYFAALGVTSSILPATLWAQLRSGAEITVATIKCAEEVAGLEFTPEQRELMVEDLEENLESYRAIRAFPLANAIAPALHFDPVPAGRTIPSIPEGPPILSDSAVELPDLASEIAFLSVRELGELIRTRRLGSEELTRIYLDRIARYDPMLHAVVTVTEERALRQARRADEEIARGDYRGPLHGIPWGAKDLLAVADYPTTWGTDPYREQRFARDAEVVQRLEAAGAVLLAKLSLGELAWGDVWFGGMTRNPWLPSQGSSGSSAGPGSATAAGLVGFSIGSETYGSISSPSTRNGVTGLRPTFGRVPRTGSMALSWSLDKLGPMCRAAEDCGLVLSAIRGVDGVDVLSDFGFQWNPQLPLSNLRLGYVPSAFEESSEQGELDRAALAAIGRTGMRLTAVELPRYPYDEMMIILSAEAAAAFDELTRSGGVDTMARQEREAWPNVFRASRSIPAVEYINANRIRTIAMEAWARLFEGVDLVVTPTSGTDQLSATNLTGHPALILPDGFRADGTPGSITFLGPLFREDRILAAGHAYQQLTDFHRRRPPLDVHLNA